MWDVFISYASADRLFVQKLADELTSQGVTVWYDQTALTLGDSLRRTIDEGLAKSRYGVVVLSPAFFQRSWTQYELDGLTTREMTSGKIILPLWHGVTQEDVAQYSPSLANKMAASTERGLPFVVGEILEVVRPGSAMTYTRQQPVASRTATTDGTTDRVKLRDVLMRYFSLEELQSLCFELNIDYDNLRGDSKQQKVIELIGYMERRGVLNELVRRVRSLRPNAGL